MSGFSARERLVRNLEIVRRHGLDALEEADIWSWFEHYSTWVQIHERFRADQYIDTAKSGGFKAIKEVDPMTAMKFFTAFTSLRVSQATSDSDEVDPAQIVELILTLAQIVAAAVG